MADQSINPANKAGAGRRTAKRVLAGEAYRRILAGVAPETLSELAEQLSAWFRETHPSERAVSREFIEDAIHDTWHHRHETIGSEL